MRFSDRKESGKLLAEKLSELKELPNLVTVALPRGGVVVASEIAKKLSTPLDIVLTRKISFPGNPEYALGAIDEKGHGIFNEELISRFQVSPEYLQKEIHRQMNEAARRRELYLPQQQETSFMKKNIILVDDGVATGFTLEVAIHFLRNFSPSQIIVAVPVISRDAFLRLSSHVEKIVTLHISDDFRAVGQFYENFDQVEDSEVIEILKIHSENFKK